MHVMNIHSLRLNFENKLKKTENKKVKFSKWLQVILKRGFYR